MRSFLTGSHAYGTPGVESDIDMVVIVSPQDLAKLWDERDVPDDEEDSTDYPPGKVAAMRFGNLNLIAVTLEHDFALWRYVTDELSKHANDIGNSRVDRPTAVAAFQSLMKGLEIKKPEAANATNP